VRPADHGKSDDSMAALIRDIEKLVLQCEDGSDEATTTVTYHYKYNQLGRRYSKAPAFQTLDGGLRKLIAAPYYWDLDFENCYPVLLTSICDCLKKPGGTPILKMFVHQRQQLMRRIMQFYNCSRKAAKQLVIKHLHGGKVRQWLVDWKIADDICARTAQSGHCKIVMDLERESTAVAEFFLKNYPEFQQLLEQIQEQERANGVEAHNMSGPMTAACPRPNPEQVRVPAKPGG
jgi:effector-binding domain-containing protein